MPLSPVKTLTRWIADAEAAGVIPASAMALATSDARGMPSVRNVVVRSVDERGLAFFTDARSPKARALAERPQAAGCFYWSVLARQVRVEGRVVRASRDEAKRAFAALDRKAQLTVLTSHQSADLTSRAALLRAHQRALKEQPTLELQAPEHWVGYFLKPRRFEFWTSNEHLLNHREQFTLRGGRWQRRLLQP